jgi:hypothetical protein
MRLKSPIVVIQFRIMAKESELFGAISLKGEVPLDEGCDSRVYILDKFPNVVFKEYHHIEQKQVEYYAKVTREAAKIAKDEKWMVNLGFFIGKYQIVMVPIREVRNINESIVGIAERVRGHNEENFNNKTELWLPGIWERFNKSLGVKGIKFTGINYRKDRKKRIIYITDLCDDIKRFCYENGMY